MDEPSTGLDPASRNSLWNVVKHAKQKRAIILTSILSQSFKDFDFEAHYSAHCPLFLLHLFLSNDSTNVFFLSLSLHMY